MLFPTLGLAAPPESSFLLRRGAIVDATRGAVYVARPNGTVESIDLASGRTQWASDAAALPLGVGDGLLVAQIEEKPRATERLLVAMLDAADGRKISEASIPLPAGVRGHVADEKGRWLYATAEREGANFLISWFYRVGLVSGTAPGVGEKTMRYYAGSARVQPGTGRVVAADGGEVGDTPGRWQRYATPPQAPWHTGDVSAYTVGGRGEELTLKRTERGSGRALPDRSLSKRAITSVASADQRHVLASERVGDGGPDDPEYRWLIFANDTAEKATELRRDVSAAPFFLSGDSVVIESRPHGYVRGGLLIEEPLELQAIRLTTGVSKWEIEIRDFQYRRSTPPAR